MPNNLKRKKVLGLTTSVFTIGTISGLGYSGWIISNNNDGKKSNLELDLGNLEESNITISTAGLNGNVNFDSYYDDSTGRVISDIDSSEHLQIRFTGILNNYSMEWGELHFNIQVEPSYKVVFNDLLSKKYIEIPSFENLNKNSQEKNTEEEGSYWRAPVNNDSRSFSVTGSFKWGSFFCGQNPSLFFDSSSNNGFKSGNDYSEEEIKSILDELNAIDGAKYTFYVDSINDNNGYEINFNSNGGKFTDYDVGNEIILDNLVLHDGIILPTPYKKGYGFLYWEYNDKQYLSNSRLYLNDIFTSDNQARKITFNAVWEDISSSGVVNFVAEDNSALASFDLIIDSQYNSQQTLSFKDNVGGNISGVVIGDVITIKNKILIDQITFQGIERLSGTDRFIVREKSFVINVIPSQNSIINFKFENPLGSQLPLDFARFQFLDMMSNVSSFFDGNSTSISTALNGSIKIDILHGLSDVISTQGLLDNGDGTYKVLSTNCTITFTLLKSYNLTFTKKAVDETNNPSAEYYIENRDNGFISQNYSVSSVSGNQSVGYILCEGDILNIIKGDDCDKIFIDSVENNSIVVGTSDITIELQGTKKECIIKGTRILTSNGYRNVEELKQGDLLIVFNHYTGQFDTSPIVFNDYDPKENFHVLYLTFSNGDKIGIVSEHGFFSTTKNKYVYITEVNVQNYLNDTFLAIGDEGLLKEVKLISFEIIKQNIQVYSPVTFKHLNLFTEKMLSMPGGINGIFNIFDMDKNHIVDKGKMNDDILQYGMFDYKDFKKYMSENFYEAFNGKYLKVALGKGLLSENKLAFLIEKYCKFDN